MGEPETNGCEAHEIALEKRAAGGLEDSEVERLEAHLKGCESCRRYAELMERMQAMIQTGNATVDASTTWRRVNAYVVRREEKASRQLTRYIPLTMFFMTLVLVLSLIDGTRWIALFATGALLSSAVHLAVLIARQRKLQQLTDSPHDLLTLVRRELVLKQVFAGSGALFAVVLGVVWMGTGLESPAGWMPSLGYHGGGPFYLAMAAIFFGYAGYLAIVALPRLRRQIAGFE